MSHLWTIFIYFGHRMLDVAINYLFIIRVGVLIGVGVLLTRLDIVPPKWGTVHHSSQVGHHGLLVVGVVVASQPRTLEAI